MERVVLSEPRSLPQPSSPLAFTTYYKYTSTNQHQNGLGIATLVACLILHDWLEYCELQRHGTKRLLSLA